MEQIFVNVRDACVLLSLGRTKFYELVSENRIETHKIGRRTLVKMESLRKFSESVDTGIRT